MYNTIADNLQEMILESPIQYQEVFDRYKQLNDWSFLIISQNNSTEMIKAFDYFYYINGRFPVEDNLFNVSKNKILEFVLSNKEISLLHLHAKN